MPRCAGSQGDTATVNAGILGVLTLPRANLAPGLTVDSHILLAIRPEHVRFSGTGVAGEIAAATFLGERSHYHVRLGEPRRAGGGEQRRRAGRQRGASGLPRPNTLSGCPRKPHVRQAQHEDVLTLSLSKGEGRSSDA